ncbi:MAG: PepSY domain-containing protein [Zoogloeaceae bacterium]|nr:PepSY domain-containing protein [Zoogloeaceae bacterium]
MSSRGSKWKQHLSSIGRWPVRVAAVGCVALLFGSGLSLADGDHDRARQALESGQILPLRTILERVEREYPGQVVDVELERDDGRWAYEIKVLRAGGALVKLKLDARDGAFVSSKEKTRTRGRANEGGH